MKINVLDYGYVEFIEAWGHGVEGMNRNSLYYPHNLLTKVQHDHEVGIIEAARMSTGKGFEGWEKDSRLLKYLYDHKHSTPFEMAGMTIEVKAPIFVFREWHRHRTQSYNEMSARYIPLPDENYLPTVERCMPTMTSNKQAQSATAKLPTYDEIAEWLYALESMYSQAQLIYEQGIKTGIPKELARLPVPVARYSRMRASANLRNWLAFLTLRLDPSAQWEIRQFADAVLQILEVQFPQTAKLFEESA